MLKDFGHLRSIDETIYLRNGALNLINGMIHMGFSSDDIHYINHKSFSDMVITPKGMLGTGFADAP
jgi:hypothetical protein